MPRNVIDIIIKNRISELLLSISNKYPKQFKKEYIDNEKGIILNKIKYVELLVNIEHKKTKSENQNININMKKTVEKKIKRNKAIIINQEDRCQARVWNSIYDKKTHKEVIDIDKRFKITDFNELKIKEFIDRYTVGRQCTRKKRYAEHYCFQHIKHNPHGNYFIDPPNELCFHYMKEGNYF